MILCIYYMVDSNLFVCLRGEGWRLKVRFLIGLNYTDLDFWHDVVWRFQIIHLTSSAKRTVQPDALCQFFDNLTCLATSCLSCENVTSSAWGSCGSSQSSSYSQQGRSRTCPPAEDAQSVCGTNRYTPVKTQKNLSPFAVLRLQYHAWFCC